jgi:hypothetical protein
VDAAGEVGLGAGKLVLDAGCREASWAIALAAAGLAGSITMMQGDLEALPLAGACCDVVWCRDVPSSERFAVLSVAHGGFRECLEWGL